MKHKFGHFLLLGTLLLSGCNNTNALEQVQIMYKYSALSEVINLEDDENESALEKLENKINDKENFILVSYADHFCSCWRVFRDVILKDYINETKIPVYVIETKALNGDFKGLKIRKDMTNTPVIGVFKDGLCKYSIDYKSDSAIFNEPDKFKAWIDKRIKEPLMTYISLDEVNELTRGDTPFLLNWSLSVCPDCIALDQNFMPGYIAKLKATPKLPYYIIETREIRADTLRWSEVKDSYGLSDVKNTVSGYGTGFVPSLQIITPNGSGKDYISEGDLSPIISDMLVFQNDQIEKVGDTFKIKDSYFNGERGVKYLGEYESEIGKVINPDDVIEIEREGETHYYFKPGARYDAHAAFAQKFFDYYWK